jgi:hypothetical protein
MKAPFLFVCLSLLLAPSTATADEVRKNDTDGFSIYCDDAE